MALGLLQNIHLRSGEGIGVARSRIAPLPLLTVDRPASGRAGPDAPWTGAGPREHAGAHGRRRAVPPYRRDLDGAGARRRRGPVGRGPPRAREWNVRELVNHVVGEDAWTVPLMRGATIAEVGDSLDGDLLGERPARDRRAPGRRGGGRGGRAAAGGGDGAPVLRRRGARRSTSGSSPPTTSSTPGTWRPRPGQDRTLDAELVDEVATLVRRPRGALPRRPGGRRRAWTPRRRRADRAARRGRAGRRVDTAAALSAFSAAFGSGDVDAIMALMTEDCVFEATGPAPDGVRRAGAADVRTVWVELFGEHAGRRVHRGGVVRRRRPGRAALAVRVDERGRHAGARPRGGRAAVPGRPGRRRSSPTSRADRAGRPSPAAAAPSRLRPGRPRRPAGRRRARPRAAPSGHPRPHTSAATRGGGRQRVGDRECGPRPARRWQNGSAPCPLAGMIPDVHAARPAAPPARVQPADERPAGRRHQGRDGRAQARGHRPDRRGRRPGRRGSGSAPSVGHTTTPLVGEAPDEVVVAVAETRASVTQLAVLDAVHAGPERLLHRLGGRGRARRPAAPGACASSTAVRSSSSGELRREQHVGPGGVHAAARHHLDHVHAAVHALPDRRPDAGRRPLTPPPR